MKKALLSLSLFTCLLNVNAQEMNHKSFSGKEASNKLSASAINKLGELFNSYTIYELDATAISNFVKNDGSQSIVDLNLGGDLQCSMSLEINNILSDDYSMIESTPNGAIAHTGLKPFTYKGYTDNNMEDLVYVSILPNYISGFIKKNGQTYFIEPISDYDRNENEQLFVVYTSNDVKADVASGCGVADAKDAMDHIGEPTNERGVMVCAMTQIAIAATSDFVSKYGGSTATQTKIVTQLNTVSGLYAQTSIDIKYTLTQFYAATSNQITPNSNTEITTCLSDFKTWANAGGFTATYDVATLWVGRDLFLSGGGVGGYAYGGSGPSSAVICTTNKYNCVEDKNSSSLNGVLQAHEIGHNWGAAHQNGSASNIMNSVVQTTSNVWTSTCVTTITTAKNNASCKSSCTTTGVVNEESNTDELKAFPNPSTGNFTIDLSSVENTTITIYNIAGEVVYSVSVKAQQKILTIDLSSEANGMYFCTIKSAEQILNRKLIIAR